MKRCPDCRRDYTDDTLLYCLDDGTRLLDGPASMDEPATAILHNGDDLGDAPARAQIHTIEQRKVAETRKNLGGLPEKQSLSAYRAAKPPRRVGSGHRLFAVVGVVVIILVGGFFAYRFYTPTKQIESIAVMPFVNDSGNAEVEYLSDGMTETLISSLSQLPNLSVKARSSVFRYKGKEADSQTIGKELNVQAILNGRVVQRGQELILYVELVEAGTENSLWTQTYNKTMTNLVALQSEIARDVADKLKVKLSGADEQRLTKNYTQNAEAYQLYLKGRYHVQRSMRAESQTGIVYFQQAIAADPAYALAYVGLADAYRVLSLGGELPSSELFPKAKAAAEKAIELDANLAEAHTALGSTLFFFDWDWKGAERELARALELDPKSGDAHGAYAFFLSNMGRHEEAIREIKLSRELDPLNLRLGALEAQYLIHAGRVDEALVRLQKTFELDPNFWLAHLFASSAYIEQGRFVEAEAEARKAEELTDASTHPTGFVGYALAKGGKQAEARIVLEKLLELSRQRYVSPYSVALIYNGLDDKEQTLAWLERGYRERTALMTFLKVEPKWNNLHGDPKFQDLMRRMAFLP
ncbi:MAG: hypothetical protein H0X08_06260 [Blastocatellia bacterium]|nr:hypothetical protein [Blastocatellia bacterium]